MPGAAVDGDVADMLLPLALVPIAAEPGAIPQSRTGGDRMHSDLVAALRELAREEIDAGRDRLLAIVAEHPDDAEAWAYLSGVQLAFADADGAQAASERALALDPDGFTPLMKAGELALRLGHLDDAERRFLAALRAAEPGTPPALAAKHALVITRTRLRVSISHGAILPRLRSPFDRWRRRGRLVEGAR